jgi:hypothetical protein
VCSSDLCVLLTRGDMLAEETPSREEPVGRISAGVSAA